ncbi:MAG: hypothetical protein V3T66_08845, partial [Alphaproteobacteria bacterium]
MALPWLYSARHLSHGSRNLSMRFGPPGIGGYSVSLGDRDHARDRAHLFAMTAEAHSNKQPTETSEYKTFA